MYVVNHTGAGGPGYAEDSDKINQCVYYNVSWKMNIVILFVKENVKLILDSLLMDYCIFS